MSYRDDKIKLLEIVCSNTNPMDLDFEETQVIHIDEHELKQEGFSYYGAKNLLKEFYDQIKQVDDTIGKDGCRELRIFAESSINYLLFDLKYPNHEIESWAEENKTNLQLTSTQQKISITIDEEKGIYQTSKTEKVYQIKIPSKKFSLIKYLSSKEKVSLPDLEEELIQNKTVIMKAIKEINDSFMKKLSVTNPLIIRLNTSGYSINKDAFEIKTN